MEFLNYHQVCMARRDSNLKGKRTLHIKNGIKGYRQRALKHYGEKCNRCGIEDVRVLLVHHEDRNRENNELENFEILCRNCHALEHHEEIQSARRVHGKTRKKKIKTKIERFINRIVY